MEIDSAGNLVYNEVREFETRKQKVIFTMTGKAKQGGRYGTGFHD